LAFICLQRTNQLIEAIRADSYSRIPVGLSGQPKVGGNGIPGSWHATSSPTSLS